MVEALQSCILFQKVHPTVIEELLSKVFHKTKKYEEGDIIFYQDEPVESLAIVVEGSVKGEMVEFSGKTIFIEELLPGRALAPAFIFGKDNNYPVNVVALQETSLLFFPKDSLLTLFQLNQKVLANYLNIVSNRAQFLAYKIRFLSFHTIKGKFAYYILELAKGSSDNNVVLPLSQSKLSELFGVTRPSLGRAIREMHNDKIIYAKNRDIQILNTYELYELLK